MFRNIEWVYYESGAAVGGSCLVESEGKLGKSYRVLRGVERKS